MGTVVIPCPVWMVLGLWLPTAEPVSVEPEADECEAGMVEEADRNLKGVRYA